MLVLFLVTRKVIVFVFKVSFEEFILADFHFDEILNLSTLSNVLAHAHEHVVAHDSLLPASVVSLLALFHPSETP